MEIFIVEGLVVRPSAEILTISPFKDIWDNDKSRNKGEAIKQFQYIKKNKQLLMKYLVENIFQMI